MAINIGVLFYEQRVEVTVLETTTTSMYIADSFIIEGEHEQLQAGLKVVSQRYGSGATWSVGLPLQLFSFRRLNFPFGKNKAVLAALPFELAEQMPHSIEQYETAAIIKSVKKDDGEEATVLAVVVAKQHINRYREILEKAEIEPAVMMPCGFALSPFLKLYGSGDSILCHRSGEQTIFYRSGKELPELYQGGAEPLELERFSAATGGKADNLLASGKDVSANGSTEWLADLRLLLNSGEAVQPQLLSIGMAMIAGQPKGAEPNFAKKKPLYERLVKGHLMQGIAVAIFIFLLAGYLLFSNIMVQKQIEQNRASVKAMFKQVIPHGRMVKPIFQMRSKLEKLKSRLSASGLLKSERSGFTTFLATLSATSASFPDVRVDELLYSHRGIVIKGRAEGVEQLRRFKAEAERAAGGAEATMETAKSIDKKSSSFTLRISE